ncbi:hypothetical protein [Methylopila turkensis]|nr:hypothetical protein [Methylopila turkensis]
MSGDATLLMMPDGDRPEAADFAAGDAFRTFEAAVRAAHERVSPKDPFAPWIRFGGTIMSPEEVMAINTPPAPLKVAEGAEVSDRLDDDLENTFPASDPPARTEP